MADFQLFFRSLGARSRIALVGGFAVIVLLVAVGAWWALRAPYGVLFSNLSEPDAAAIVQELDKLKLPYQLAGEGGQGQTILVPESTVHKTRMTLMGRQMPLHGAVGFELFNNTDFGVSDFVQKVNYQRALQGELTRTILALEPVQSVRVHLALPEQGLFRKESSSKAKASITLVTKQGERLEPSHVAGIQRLVASSVPDIRAEDVTVTDQHGATLSKALPEEGGVTGAALDASVDLEARLVRKATVVLERMFGAGQALVTVEVGLNHQHTRVTTEEVLAASNGNAEQAPAGVVVRERTSTRQGGEGAAPGGTGKVTSQEIDYQAGKRVMQVVSPGGTVSRLNVAVVIKRSLSDAEVQRVRELVMAAVGAQTARGDVIALYAVSPSRLDVHAEPAAPGPATSPGAAPAEPVVRQAAIESVPEAAAGEVPAAKRVGIVAAAAIVLLGLFALWLHARQRQQALGPVPARSLTPSERDALLKSVHQWLGTSEGRA